MELKKVAYHLPFGCLVYFHIQKERYSDLVDRLEKEEAQSAIHLYKKTSTKFVAGGLVSMLPGAILTYYTGNLIPILINFVISHNYSEFLFGKKIERWVEEQNFLTS